MTICVIPYSAANAAAVLTTAAFELHRRAPICCVVAADVVDALWVARQSIQLFSRRLDIDGIPRRARGRSASRAAQRSSCSAEGSPSSADHLLVPTLPGARSLRSVRLSADGPFPPVPFRADQGQIGLGGEIGRPCRSVPSRRVPAAAALADPRPKRRRSRARRPSPGCSRGTRSCLHADGRVHHVVQVLDIESADDVDAGLQQFVDVLIAAPFKLPVHWYGPIRRPAPGWAVARSHRCPSLRARRGTRSCAAS